MNEWFIKNSVYGSGGLFHCGANLCSDIPKEWVWYWASYPPGYLNEIVIASLLWWRISKLHKFSLQKSRMPRIISVKWYFPENSFSWIVSSIRVNVKDEISSLWEITRNLILTFSRDLQAQVWSPTCLHWKTWGVIWILWFSTNPCNHPP